MFQSPIVSTHPQSKPASEEPRINEGVHEVDAHCTQPNYNDVFLMAEALEHTDTQYNDNQDDYCHRDQTLLRQKAYKTLLNVL